MNTTSNGLRVKLIIPIVLLKADDLFFDKQHSVHPNWKNYANFIEQMKIKSSIGVIGNSIKQGNEEYILWIKDLKTRGNIEFWNHGYNHRRYGLLKKKTEFHGRSYGEQYRHLKKAQDLAQKKLGFKFKVFGSPYNRNDKNTIKALEQFPEIVAWFFPEYLDSFSILLLERCCSIDIEVPRKKPNYRKFIADYLHLTNQKYIVFQIHPRSWDKHDFCEFSKVINFLIGEGSQFVTPSEFSNLACNYIDS